MFRSALPEAAAMPESRAAEKILQKSGARCAALQEFSFYRGKSRDARAAAILPFLFDLNHSAHAGQKCAWTLHGGASFPASKRKQTRINKFSGSESGPRRRVGLRLR